MELTSVNIGHSCAIRAKTSGHTGIYKLPEDGPVRITSMGLVGDVIVDTKNHGGVDQAVYIYGMPDYAWWSETLGQKLAPGTFGENLTITDLESAQMTIGDRLHVGTVILEVTAPRIPCATLAARMGDPAFVKRFRVAERPGLYCRVVQEGLVQVGDPVTVELYQGEPVPAIELFRYFFAPDHQEATIRRHLAAPIAIRDRVDKERQLRKIVAKAAATT